MSNYDEYILFDLILDEKLEDTEGFIVFCEDCKCPYQEICDGLCVGEWCEGVNSNTKEVDLDTECILGSNCRDCIHDCANCENSNYNRCNDCQCTNECVVEDEECNLCQDCINCSCEVSDMREGDGFNCIYNCESCKDKNIGLYDENEYVGEDEDVCVYIDRIGNEECNLCQDCKNCSCRVKGMCRDCVCEGDGCNCVCDCKYCNAEEIFNVEDIYDIECDVEDCNIEEKFDEIVEDKENL